MENEKLLEHQFKLECLKQAASVYQCRPVTEKSVTSVVGLAQEFYNFICSK